MTNTTTRALTAREISTMPIDQLLERHQKPVPAGRVRCFPCEGTGEMTYGFVNGMPLSDSCSWCNGVGHKPAKLSS